MVGDTGLALAIRDSHEKTGAMSSREKEFFICGGHLEQADVKLACAAWYEMP